MSRDASRRPAGDEFGNWIQKSGSAMMIQQGRPRSFRTCNPARLRVLLTLIVLASASSSSAQTLGKAPTLTIAAVPLTTAQRAQATMVNLNFRVPPGYHINSNTPKSEFLIPTALKMDLPTDIILGKIEYPAGEDKSFPFSPDEKLSVYSGDFTIAVAVHPLHSVVPGKYNMHGVLR
jgi:hypothetical protein